MTLWAFVCLRPLFAPRPPPNPNPTFPHFAAFHFLDGKLTAVPTENELSEQTKDEIKLLENISSFLFVVIDVLILVLFTQNQSVWLQKHPSAIR
jgi:hypothetical protein